MSKANDFVNQWGVFGRTMTFYRWFALLSLILAMTTAIALVTFESRNPLVVAKECGNKDFYLAKRHTVAIEGRDVEKFAKTFIKAFYGDNGHRCMMAEGLQNKLQTTRQKLARYVGAIEIVLQEKLTLANFDLIMSVKNVPLVVRKQVQLQIIQGKKTACNPIGLYVNGIKEKGGK